MNIQEIVSSSEQRSHEKERLRLLVIGTPEGVTETIQTLEKLRYAEVRSWSPLLPVPNSDEVMSILTRWRPPQTLDIQEPS